MFTTTIQKTVVDPDTGDELLYSFVTTGETAEQSVSLACTYASMVEYGMEAEKWAPAEMAFPREQLYQFIQPQQLANIEAMYPDAVATAYQSALAYVQSYIGAMFDITAMLDSEDTSSTALTLRLALAICTATYILSSSPQFSEVIELQNKQLHTLLRGLKSGNRNFGKAAIAGEPNVRVQVVKLERSGAKP